LTISEAIVLLTRETLLERLRHHLQESSQVDIAVAWACDCDALSGLIQFANSGTPLRAIIGISGNATHPNALRGLKGCGQLRIATNAEGLFHPKFYLFHQHIGRIAWIGSANLTRRGFQQNEELVFEFADEDGRASEWFNRLSDSLPKDCSNTLATYEKNWHPPPPPPLHPHQDRVAGSASETYTHWAAD
jgi:HKD family nuclease